MGEATSASDPSIPVKGYTGEVEFIKEVMVSPRTPEIIVHYGQLVFRDGLLVEVKLLSGKTHVLGAAPKA